MQANRSQFAPSRVRSILASAVVLALPAIASAQVDQFQFFFDGTTATGGTNALGGFAYQSASSFYTAGFTGASQALRHITFNGATWNGQVNVGQTDWVNKFLASTSVTDNGGNGTILPANFSSLSVIGDLQLNTATITIAGISYAPGTVGIALDQATVRDTSAGNAVQPQHSKIVYAYDLRQVGAANAGRDRNASGIVDWNDVFDPIVTLADMQIVQNGGTSTQTPNIARRFAFSSNGQSIYYTDAQANFGGIWKVNLTQTGTSAIAKLVESRSAGTFISTEPFVLHTSQRDFANGAAGAGDQVIFRGSTDTGNIGGINYIVDTGAPSPPPRVLLSAKQFAAFHDFPNASFDLISVTADSGGNLYMANGNNHSGLYLYDTQGRLAKLANETERRIYINSITGTNTFNINILDTKARTAAVPLTGGGTANLTQVLYTDATLRTPIGITAYKVGDFNRDNLVNATDVGLFKAVLGLRGATVASLVTTSNPISFTPTNPERLKFDLNGANTTSVTGGGNTTVTSNVAVDWKDVKIFQQFAGLSDGDVDMDFDVDGVDLDTIAANYNGDGKLFTQGNLTSVRIANADRDTVNYGDLVTIAANWTAANPNLAGYSAAFQADADRAFAITAGGSRHQYTARGNGAWSNAANWSNGVPNGAGDVANLLTKPQDDMTLTVDGVFTVGQLNFDNFFTYTLGGGGALLMAGANGRNAEINTFAASPTIAAPLGINTNTDVTVTYSDDTLTLSGPMLNTTGRTLTKNGAGKLAISGTQTHGAGASLVVNAGTVDLSSNAGTGGANLAMTIAGFAAANVNAGQNMANITNNGALNVIAGDSVVGAIDGTGNLAVATPATITATRYRQSLVTINGRATVAPNGTNAALSTVDLLFLPGDGTLDLTDNDLIVRSSTYGAVTAEIASARNGGIWDGPGITSSAAKNATPKDKTLGTLTGAQLISTGVTTFDGVTVAPSDVLVKFTWYGDTDLNGVVNFDDYSRTDAGFNTGGTDWFRGDFDYNDLVNFDDYSLIDLAFNTQSGTLRDAMSYLDGSDRNDAKMTSPSLQKVLDHFEQFGQQYATSFLNAVPEPTSALGVSALVVVFGFRRRRKSVATTTSSACR